MSRTFVYARVSSVGQTTANQLQEVEAAGFSVQPRRIIEETISGSVPAQSRPGFVRLLDRLEEGDILIVTKMDRLGRDAIDVSTTVSSLAELGVRVHCLALGGLDLTSAAGRLTMNVINSVAQFERDLLIERTQAGLARARAEGKSLGRRPLLSDRKRKTVLDELAAGATVSGLARKYGVSRQTIIRVKGASAGEGVLVE